MMPESHWKIHGDDTYFCLAELQPGGSEQEVWIQDENHTVEGRLNREQMAGLIGSLLGRVLIMGELPEPATVEPLQGILSPETVQDIIARTVNFILDERIGPEIPAQGQNSP